MPGPFSLSLCSSFAFYLFGLVTGIYVSYEFSSMNSDSASILTSASASASASASILNSNSPATSQLTRFIATTKQRDDYRAIQQADKFARLGTPISVSFPPWSFSPYLSASYFSDPPSPSVPVTPVPAIYDVSASGSWASSSISAHSHSQVGEDAIAYTHLFSQRVNASFLEMGALDGVLFSNTLAFERAMGWRGVLIEAAPVQHSACIRNRPLAICLSMATCPSADTVHYRSPDESASAVGTIVEFATEERLVAYQFPTGAEKYLGTIPIPCLPLSSVFSLLGISYVTWFSLDVEGGETAVLDSIDFEQVRFDVITVEANDSTQWNDVDIAIKAKLKKHGYEHFRRENGSDWYTHIDFKPSRAPDAK